jgi:hypothetical protein
MKEERLTVRFYLVVGVSEDTNHVDFGAHHAKPAIQKEFKTRRVCTYASFEGFLNAPIADSMSRLAYTGMFNTG